MKKLILLCITALHLTVAFSKPRVIWTEGRPDPQTNLAAQTITLVDAPDGTDWTLWFTSSIFDAKATDDSEGEIVIFQGPASVIYPKVRSGKDFVVKYMERPFGPHSEAPDGFVLECDGKAIPLDVTYEFLPSERVPDFEYSHVETNVWDMVPRLKSVTTSDGYTKLGRCPQPIFVKDAPAEGWYRITLDGSCKIEAVDEDGAQYARVTLDNLKRNVGSKVVPNMVIEDWPDLNYRGFMLDIARNFTSKKQIMKIIDVLAHYKVNVFHLHFTDDEGWRLEIEKFSELTSYGARHSFPVKQDDGGFVEENSLGLSYGSFNTEVADGFLTKKDYIEILRYAWERRIKVIPEFDIPAHSYAAVRSMEAYAKRTGDDSYLLSELGDLSEYRSVQKFSKNAINVALPSTYNFIESVFDHLIAYHEEAGVPLMAIHVGGDEVPSGAWTKSPACQKIMEEKGWRNYRNLKSYFLEKVIDIAELKGVKIAGWQEMVHDVDPSLKERIMKSLLFVNLWRTKGRRDQLTYQYANEGYPVILSNSPNTYLDLAYTCDRTEPGRFWSGFIDERRAFSLLPYDIYKSIRWYEDGRILNIAKSSRGKTPLEKKENIIGVQAQLWGESIRNFSQTTYYIFPKALGIFERGWNASPVWEATNKSDDPIFMEDLNAWYSTVVSHEFPYLERMKINYRKR